MSIGETVAEPVDLLIITDVGFPHTNSSSRRVVIPNKYYLLLGAIIFSAGLVSGQEREGVLFGEAIYPLLSKHCFSCHTGADAEAGVRLDRRREILGESDGRPLAVPGKSGASRLIARIESDDPDTRMPPDGEPLAAKEISLLRAWIDQGLSWDESLLPHDDEGEDHWAFAPVQRPEPPFVRGWAENPVDAFIAAEHQKRNLVPASQASRRTLIRRLSLDIRGLPPSPRETSAFIADPSPDAYERLVEQYLASPQYGERWGRHWLDVARWAETEGYESNHTRRFAWRYRDYVIRSFNHDKPYSFFLTQQLAGDELAPYADENVIATGFLAAARLSSNEEDKWLQRNAMLVDVVNTVGNALLGLTVNCAQCHSHKFDPITLRDYYQLQAFFLPGQPMDVRLSRKELVQDYESRRPEEYEPALKLKRALFEAARKKLIAEAKKSLSPEQLKAVETPIDQRTPRQELLARKADLKFQATPNGIERYLSAEDRPLYEQLKKKIASIEKQSPPIPQAFVFYSPATSPHELEVLPSVGFYPLPFEPDVFKRRIAYLQVRGDVHAIGPQVEADWPQVLARQRHREDRGERAQAEAGQDPRSRLRLAHWLTRREHPLTARVWVNRIWHHHFGRGLVATPGDFGLRGARPTHPDLLDWLAAELVDSGWSTKHIQRLILTSATYRQASVRKAGPVHADDENAFLTRFRPRRLEAEALRDSILAAAGRLEQSMGGPSIAEQQTEPSSRRSIYLFQKRGAPPEMQGLFDGPRESAESCSRRHTSTTAMQSLFLLNSEFCLRQAEHLASRVEVECSQQEDQLVRVFQLLLSRRPDPDELNTAIRFVRRHPNPSRAMTDFCHAMINLNEFAYLQ